MSKLNALFVSLANAASAAEPRDTRAMVQAVPASDPAENEGFVQHAKAWIARDTLLASLNRSHSDHTTRFVRAAIDADGVVSETRVRIIAESINTARPITAGNNARKSALICANVVLKDQAGFCLRLKNNEVVHAPWSEEQASALKQREADKAAAVAQRAADKVAPPTPKPEPEATIAGPAMATLDHGIAVAFDRWCDQTGMAPSELIPEINAALDVMSAINAMCNDSGLTIEEVLNIARDAVSERMIQDMRDAERA